MTNTMKEILHQMHFLRKEECPFVFHINSQPINYGTHLTRVTRAQIKADVECRGTHILRIGKAKAARRIGGIDAVVAVTGHKDLKMADHYSKLDLEMKKDVHDRLDHAFRTEVLSLANQLEKPKNVLSLCRT